MSSEGNENEGVTASHLQCSNMGLLPEAIPFKPIWYLPDKDHLWLWRLELLGPPKKLSDIAVIPSSLLQWKPIVVV